MEEDIKRFLDSARNDRQKAECWPDLAAHAASPLHPHANPLCDSVEVTSNGYCRSGHRMAVMRILLALWKEIPHARRHLASCG
jgi:hypothetical protein